MVSKEIRSLNSIKHYLWRMAGFNNFIVSFCPTLNNHIAGIGLHYILQLTLVFISANLVFQHLPGSFFTGLPISFIVVWAIWFCIKNTIRLQHKYNSTSFLIFALIANLILALIISVPLCLALFQDEINLALAINIRGDTKNFITNLARPVQGLFLAGVDMNQYVIIRACCGSIYSFILFCCYIPYLSTYQVLKSTYKTIIKLYEQNFR